jgi:hypothetical protein
MKSKKTPKKKSGKDSVKLTPCYFTYDGAYVFGPKEETTWEASEKVWRSLVKRGVIV